MMENMMYVQQYLQKVEMQLWDIDNLSPSEFVNHLQMCPLPGWEQKVIAMLRQAIFEFQNQRIITKYLQIVDQLSKVPGFQNAVQNSIVDIFCDIFYFLHLQKCYKDMEKIKILRKFWVGKVHPFLLQQMKDKILHKINCDIDHGIKAEIVDKIKVHYASKLNMTPEQIQRQFPPAKTIDEAKYAQKYMIDAPIYQNPNHYYNGNHTFRNGNHHQNYSSHGYMPYQSPVHSSIIEQNNNYDYDMQFNEQTKRKRFASEETRATGYKNSEPSQARVRKSQHRDEGALNFRAMLSNLKAISAYSCKECGMMFGTLESIEQHKNKHFKQKLLKIEGCEGAKLVCFMSQKRWRGEAQEGSINHDKFTIKEARWPREQAICILCNSQLTMQFKDDQWAFINATLVSIHSQQHIMHKNCQLTYQQSLKKKQNAL